MIVENGEWIIQGPERGNPFGINSWQDLVRRIEETGFLPYFANEVRGFSAEEQIPPDFWWTGDERDPWEWREIIAASRQVAYGKFFGQRAGFISLKWLPYFVNSRRSGYDFDSRWQDGLASRREKKIMDIFLDEDDDGDIIFRQEGILSTELKKLAGFGKHGEKNFPSIITGLQMQTYLVISEFRRRKNKRGEEYGMPVSVLLPPETIWGYDTVTAAYSEKPKDSWGRLFEHMREMYGNADEKDILRLLGKEPEE